MISRRLDLGHITLNVREAGSGPLVVLLHGVTGQSAVWLPVMDDLSPDFRVVSVDQRGHGLSDKPATGYDGSDYADDVAALIRELGDQALVVGHSLGSRNAILLAGAAPDLLTGIVGIDFTPHIETPVFDALESRVNAGATEFADVAAIRAYLRNRYPYMPEDAVERRSDHGYQFVDGAYRALADPRAMSQTVVGLRESLVGAVDAIACPALLVRGADSTLVTEAAFAATAAQRPDLAMAVVAQADHYVPEAQPGAVAALIASFHGSIS